MDGSNPLDGNEPGSAPRIAAVRPAALFGDHGMVGYQVVRVDLPDDRWDATGQVIRVADRHEAGATALVAGPIDDLAG